MSDQQQELFSIRIPAGPRTYFFDIKESREGFRYLVISEARRTESGEKYEYDRVMVFEEYIDSFAEAFSQALSRFQELTNVSEVEESLLPSTSTPPETEIESGNSEKAYDVSEIRQQHPKAYASWSQEDDNRLRSRYLEGATLSELAGEFGRQPGGIRSRLSKLGLV